MDTLIREFWGALSSPLTRNRIDNSMIVQDTESTAFLLPCVLILGLLVLPQGTLAQEQVSGTVVDSTSANPLPGVNVVLKGTTGGTATGAEGTFQLSVPSLQDTLVVSFVGYQTKEVPIDGRSEIRVQLAPEVVRGEELVVVGYGQQERRQVTGSVSTIEEADFVTGNVNDPLELIQGKVSGLSITRRSGNPNGESQVRLRGISSFGANQEPLVVVDGIIGASLENINPDNIGSINVLKDASSAAIYGTRGSAGAIVIETKSGQGSDFSASYSASVTVEDTENEFDPLSADEFRQLSEMSGIEIQDFGTSTNWIDEISQLGTNQQHSLAISSDVGEMNYRISGNYTDRRGIQKQTGFEEINGRLNATQRALEGDLQFTAQMSVTDQDQQLGSAEVFKYAGITNPTHPVKDEGFENTGGFVELSLFDYFNPVNIIENGSRNGEEFLFNGALRGEYDFSDVVPGLTAAAFYAREVNSVVRREFASKEHKLTGGATQSSLGPGFAEQRKRKETENLFEATADYTTEISDLDIDVTGGWSYNDFVDEGSAASGGDFVADAVGTSNFQFAQDFNQGEGTVTSFKEEHKIVGGFGRLSLNWSNTYFANGSIRREGSSRFGENNKYGTFWAAGGGIEVTNLVDLPFFNSLRLRGSIGKTGQNAPRSGLTRQRFAPRGNFFAGGRFIQSFGPVSNPNPDLKWEEKTEINVGVEFTALDQRLNGTLEAYQSTTDDLLFEVGVPVPPNLFPTTWDNVGEIENSGIEGSFEYTAVQTENFSLTTSVNGTLMSETKLNDFVSEEVRFLASPGSPGLNNPDLLRIKEGEPLGQLWGPEYAGISDDGRWLFKDADGNEVTFDELEEEDRRIIGSGLPTFQGGWSTQISYRNFSFSLFLEGTFGHDLANMFDLFYTSPLQIGSYNVLDDALNSDLRNLRENPRWSSRFVEDAGFVRIQNLSLSYNVPISRTVDAVDQLRLSFSVNNLHTFTGYSGIDPQVRWVDEQRASTNDPDNFANELGPGIERRADWFTARSWTLGVDIQL